MTVNSRIITKLFTKNSISKVNKRYLKQKGQHVYGKLTDFQLCNSNNNSYNNYHKNSILGDDPEYQLVAEWHNPKTNRTLRLKSNSIKADEETIKYFFTTYRTVSIYIDPKNPEHYYFDLPLFIKSQAK